MEDREEKSVVIQCVKRAFSTLNSIFLNDLYDDGIYSNLDKEGIIEDLNFKIEKIKKKYKAPLHILPGKCTFCYPEGTTIKFVDSESEQRVIQIVVFQEGIKEYRVEECKNNPIPETSNSLPF